MWFSRQATRFAPPRARQACSGCKLQARRLFEDGARANRRARAVPCSGRRGTRASKVEVGLLGLPRQNIEPSSLQEKLHVDLTGQGSRGKRHRGKAESPETSMLSAQLRLRFALRRAVFSPPRDRTELQRRSGCPIYLPLRKTSALPLGLSIYPWKRRAPRHAGWMKWRLPRH